MATETANAVDTAVAGADATATETAVAADETAVAQGDDGVDAGADVGAGGEDFGVCDPTMKFEGALGGRPGECNPRGSGPN